MAASADGEHSAAEPSLEEEASLLARKREVAARSAPSPPAILFFDGKCNLCNATVDYFIRLDRASNPPRIMVASLQSPAAEQALKDKGVRTDQFINQSDPSQETVVYLSPSGAIATRSDAILRAAAHLGPWWLRALCWLFLLLPALLRDIAYRTVARFRIRLFGSRPTCRMPTKADRRHFL